MFLVRYIEIAVKPNFLSFVENKITYFYVFHRKRKSHRFGTT